jgi:hypothetical protein
MTRDASVPQAWTRDAVVGGAIYFVLFAFAVSLFETVGRLIAMPDFGGAPDFDIRELLLIVTAWAAAIAAASANGVPDRPAPRLLMGAVAFVLLILAQAYLALVIENHSRVQVARSAGSLTGLLRLLGCLAFALAPLVQIWVRWHAPEQRSSEQPGAGAKSLHS